MQQKEDGKPQKQGAALISWIGDVDLVEYLRTLSQSDQEKIINEMTESQNVANIKRRLQQPPTPRDKSPIITILEKCGDKRDALFLLTNRLYGELNTDYRKFLAKTFKGEIRIIDLSKKVENIADLPKIYKETQSVIEEHICPRYKTLYCNLTSGAGVTASALVMLASAYFNDYHICQVYEGEISHDERLPDDFSALIRKRGIMEAAVSTGIIGNSEQMRNILKTAMHIAPYDCNVLILGPSGTGKSMLAREIHEKSTRKGEFRHVNCGGLTPTLLESRLFGHKKGTFTDAKEDKEGEFKLADGGTLFLDEIAECSPDMQQMLLNVLQPRKNDSPTTRRYTVMGGKEESSDVRVIAATNKPLGQLVREGKFREDLFYRLATTRLTMPALADHPDDIAPIAQSFLGEINRANDNVPGYVPKMLSGDALEKLRAYAWPGNVRELQNVLHESAMFTDGDRITTADINFHQDAHEETDAPALPQPEDFSLDQIMRDMETRYIEAALRLSDGNKAMASRRLGMKTPQNLESRLKALNLKLERKTPLPCA